MSLTATGLILAVRRYPKAIKRHHQNSMIFISDHDPLAALAICEKPGTLAVLSHVEGPSYRSLGATMAIMFDGKHVGTLSSGCIESDLAHHAEKAKVTGQPVTVRYGHGSPFIDIELPCGGAIEITLIHAPDQQVLADLIKIINRRETRTLQINCQSGKLALSTYQTTAKTNDVLCVGLTPKLRFIVFGKGLEAITFVSLVQSAHFEGILLSPNLEMCEQAESRGCETYHLTTPNFPAEIGVDEWTSIVLFFHDHDWEPPILEKALASPAFYIGAQGSKRSRENLMNKLQFLGISDKQQTRLKGPIGLIPSTRDARTLAISVLAEVLALGKTGRA